VARNGKDTIVCVDCPFDTGDQQITQFMRARRDRAGGLYDELTRRGYKLKKLLNPTLTELEQAMDDPSVAFLTASGHGSKDGQSFLRNADEDLIHAGRGFYNRGVFDGKIVHFFACDTARSLGINLSNPDSTGAAVAAFFGYNADFSFAADFRKDPGAADLFIDCDSEIDLALADGLSPQDAHAVGLGAFDRLINQWIADKSRAELVDLVRKDRLALCLLPAQPKAVSISA